MINSSKKIFQKARHLQPTTYNLPPKKGFTVIELLVVVAIIGIVSGIIVASVSGSKAKGRDAKRIADISVIQLALERYYDEKHYYPVYLSSSGNDDLSDYDSSVPTKDSLDNNYLYKVLNGDNATACSADCQSYHLGATLELYNGILADDTDLNSEVSGDFDGSDNTNDTFMYDVLPKF